MIYFRENSIECDVGSHDCSPAATCVDTEGSYRCECPSGYIWNHYYRKCRENPRFTFTGSSNMSTIPDYVSEVTFDGVPIETIHLEFLSNSSNLSALNFLHNNMTVLEPKFWIHLNNLTELRIELNPLSSLSKNSFLYLEDLQRLYLRNNNISVIEKGTFNNLTRLRYPSLYRNNIYHLVPGTFLGIKQLQFLDLSKNFLQTVEWNVFDPKFSLGKYCI